MHLKCGKVVKRVHFGKAAGMYQAHEKIADICAPLGLKKQRVFPVEDRPFKDLFTQIIVEGGVGDLKK